MTREEKLQAIKDMGIRVEIDCPVNFGFDNKCHKYERCAECWIITLEEKQ